MQRGKDAGFDAVAGRCVVAANHEVCCGRLLGVLHHHRGGLKAGKLLLKLRNVVETGSPLRGCQADQIVQHNVLSGIGAVAIGGDLTFHNARPIDSGLGPWRLGEGGHGCGDPFPCPRFDIGSRETEDAHSLVIIVDLQVEAAINVRLNPKRDFGDPG